MTSEDAMNAPRMDLQWLIDSDIDGLLDTPEKLSLIHI